MTVLVPARMRPRDVVRVGGAGLRARPLRVFLSALGIAIGIAAMLGVVGISASSQEDLNRQLAALGTNLLTVSPGRTLFGEESHLPAEAEGMIARIGPVTSVTATGTTPAKVYRNDHVPDAETGSISVTAARLDLLRDVGATLAGGAWLNEATHRYPATVLGAKAADRLGVVQAGPDQRVWLGGQWFTVVGVLAPAPLAPEVDTAALVGWPVAEERLDFDGYPTTIYARAREESVVAVRDVLAATANPQTPNEVEVSRPSDVLAAKQATDATLNALLLGLGGVALLVGGVGVANTMVISVLERRAEIGLRRSLGATRGQVRAQFLAESLLLSAIGGVGGVLLGIGVTAAYAGFQGWPTIVPVWAMLGGVFATLAIGGVAGFYPAVRAARMSPTEALATP
ncbi:ABC transporter permease [Nonomuraea jiangxiensis]|uniref:Putative ABC transport system permease protein n=1 Tax=Nonomuraea jiangxiensis TaxID=633440 RepID=A0A1G9SC25_9ACTN|nr:ABC transporter permease [Nonomuraea jiangxiensis]SDM32870.1 putative ABC transport system permease protein [Nonomuraea jiangxiensis]